MLQHRRTLIVILAALSLFYVYRLRTISQKNRSPAWIPWDQNEGGVLNSTLGFAEIFVINLVSRRDRRDAMTTAGAVSNLTFTFLEAFTGDSVPASSAAGKGTNREPAGAASSHSALAGARGSWHSHLNALQTIVDRGLGSALVLEDDVDWDVRLGTQMKTFALAARAWLEVERQRRETASRAGDEKSMKPRAGVGLVGPSVNLTPNRRKVIEEGLEQDTITLPPSLRPSSLAHAESPYGDGWDVLWLGHCGADLPSERHGAPPSGDPLPSSSPLKIAIPNDVTVPAPKHLKPHPFALHDQLADAYPAHTRVVHAASGNVCSLAYAVSQRGARKLLMRLGGEGFVDQWDLMLMEYCKGGYEDKGEEVGRPDRLAPVCLTVQPPLISHHYAGDGSAGGGGASVSNIRGQGGGFARGRKGTPYVRLSVQENLGRLVAGFPVDRLVDQLPDEGSELW